MDALARFDRSLTAAAHALESAADELRMSEVDGLPEGLGRVGRALAEIFSIQHAIYELRPDLRPQFLNEDHTSPDNRLLTAAMAKSSELEEGGDIPKAIAELERCLISATSEFHIKIASHELSRMKKRGAEKP